MGDPSGDVPERTLRKLWSAVLGVDEDEIKSESNFFELGGDSVSAIRLLNRSSECGMNLDSSEVYLRSTFNDMLKSCQEAPNELVNGHLHDLQEEQHLRRWITKQCNIRDDDIEAILPCTSLQKDFMLSHLESGLYLFQATFRISGPLERFYQAWNTIMQRNPIFRTRFVRNGDKWYQVVVSEETTWLHIHNIDAYKAGDKARGVRLGEPLSRQAIAYEDGQTWFIWTVLHAIQDGWTRRLMYTDLKSCFENSHAFLQQPSRPPFSTYTQFLERIGSDRALSYWDNLLDGLERFDLLYPAAWDKPQIALTRTSKLVTVPSSSSVSIGQAAIAHAAWAMVLFTVSGESDVFFASDRSGRACGPKNVDAVMGAMLATVPFRICVNPELSIREFLLEVKKQLVNGTPFEAWGREALYRHFGHNKSLQSNLLPQLRDADVLYDAVTGTNGDTTMTLTPIEQHISPCEVGLLLSSYPRGKDHQYLMAKFDEELISYDRMNGILDIYGNALSILSQNADSLGRLSILLNEMKEQYSQASDQAIGQVEESDISADVLEDLLAPVARSGSIIAPQKSSMSVSSKHLRDLIHKAKIILIEHGVRRSHMISVAIPNNLEFLIIFFAVTSLGATVAPLNPAYRQTEFEFYLRSSSSFLVVVSRESYKNKSLAIESAQKLSIPAYELFTDGTTIEFDHMNTIKAAAAMTSDRDPKAVPEDIALLLYTSGTTGAPKAVPLTHRNLICGASTVRETYDLKWSDRSLLIMPLFHIHGIVAGLLAPLLAKSTIVLSSSVAPNFWQLAVRNRITWFTGTPTMHKMITQLPEPPKKPNLRFVRSCSSPLSPALLSELEDLYDGPVLEAYAMTEAAHQMTSNRANAPRVPGCVGKPTNIELIVLADDGSIAPADATGEICIRGPNVMQGYLDNPDANARAFTAEGYLRTGDQGKQDTNGFIRLTGRIKELINKGGEKISPIEIDHIIGKHESVSEAVSFAVPDDIYGEVVGVAIIFKDGRTTPENELKKWLRERIAGHKIPSHFYFPNEIPRTATGKIQRLAVKKNMLVE